MRLVIALEKSFVRLHNQVWRCRIRKVVLNSLGLTVAFTDGLDLLVCHPQDGVRRMTLLRQDPYREPVGRITLLCLRRLLLPPKQGAELVGRFPLLRFRRFLLHPRQTPGAASRCPLLWLRRLLLHLSLSVAVELPLRHQSVEDLPQVPQVPQDYPRSYICSCTPAPWTTIGIGQLADS
jgi:hypothetical protein